MYRSLERLWYPIVTDLRPSLSGVRYLAFDQNFSNTLHLFIIQFRILSLYLGTLAVLLMRLMPPCLSSPKYCWIKTCENEKQNNTQQAIWIYHKYRMKSFTKITYILLYSLVPRAFGILKKSREYPLDVVKGDSYLDYVILKQTSPVI